MKLKPCPFCGGTDIQIKDEEKWSYIWCGDCLSAFWQREACSVEDNVEAWNKRTIITKHDKYTFNGEWACTDHMTIREINTNSREDTCKNCPELDINYNSDESYCNLAEGEEVRLKRGQHRPEWCPKRAWKK